jgi:NADH-quinone oxidoreductase subunit H
LVFRQPFTFAAFVLFFIASLASNKRAPFDLPESDSELVAGYHTEYSGLRFSLFYLAEYNAMFVTSGIMVALFLGSWADPFGLIARRYETAIVDAERWTPLLWNCAAAGVFVTKCSLVMFVQMWVRWTLPRPRIDQVLHSCVKVMVPLSLAMLLGSAVWELLVSHESKTESFVRITLASFGVVVLVGMATIVAGAFVTGRRDQKRLGGLLRPSGAGA